MSKNLSALQQALNRQQSAPAPVALAATAAPVAASQTDAAAPGYYKAPSRAGKVNITAYLSPDYKSNLRLIQARTGKSLQTIIAESLNETFRQYDVPVIQGE
jgi:hypothetical protein